jgi:hypothetical protein
MRYAILLAVMMLALAPALASAGKLNDFESSLSNKPTKSSTTTSSNSSSSSSSDSDATSSLLDVIFTLMFFSGRTSSSSTQGDPFAPSTENRGNLYGSTLKEVNANLRKGHSFALPNIRLDGFYDYVVDDVQAFHLHGEGGYLLAGVDIDFTRYYEQADRLNNLAAHGLLRLPLAGELYELDVALGYRRIWGDLTHQGFDFGFPMYLNLGQYFQIYGKWFGTVINGRLVTDTSIGAAFKYRLGGIQAGYRNVDIRGSTLYGPEVGVFFQW